MDEGLTLLEGIFPQKTRHLQGDISYVFGIFAIDESFVEGMYLYELLYKEVDSKKWIQVASSGIPQPGVEKKPILKVLREYPRVILQIGP